MNTWFLILSKDALDKNPNFIGIGEKRGEKVIPKNATLISEGDKIIYYVKFLHKIIGVFEVKNTNKKIWKDKQIHFEIQKISKNNEPIDIKDLINELELFSHLSDIHSKWGASIQGISNSVKKLSKKDYEIILESFSK